MTNHLFLLTIGPVQSFIAQARKTRDLYAGSHILSQLVQVGIQTFMAEFPKSKIIYPTAGINATSLPNRLIGNVAPEDAEQLIIKAATIEKAVRAKFLYFAQRSLLDAKESKNLAFDAQIEAHLEVYWVFKEVLNNDYAVAYAALEQLEGGIKNIRTFKQYDYNGLGEAGRKCSIDGINNALFYRQDGGGNPQSLEAAKPLKYSFALNPGEGLSAISLTKRFFKTVVSDFDTDQFPSTAHVALLKDIAEMPSEALKHLEQYKAIFSKPQHPEPDWNSLFDYQFIFEENLTDKNIPNATQLDLVQKLQPELKKYLKTKYYAMVLFDGDQMGKWLSGAFNASLDTLESFHVEFSAALSTFSESAQQKLNMTQMNGKTVYTGGDDFLGLVNIHHLFEVMTDLRQKFDKQVNQKITPYKQASGNKHLTFTAGIVIAHYKTPFSEVLKTARDIEKKAKKENDGKRNAFGITVLKHSGETQESIFHWDEQETAAGRSSNWDALNQIFIALDAEEGAFSNQFIQSLDHTFNKLTGIDLHPIEVSRSKSMIETLNKAIACEIERSITRAYKSENQEKAKEQIDRLTRAVQALWNNAKGPNRARHFIHALHIVDFLTRKTKEA